MLSGGGGGRAVAALVEEPRSERCCRARLDESRLRRAVAVEVEAAGRDRPGSQPAAEADGGGWMKDSEEDRCAFCEGRWSDGGGGGGGEEERVWGDECECR